jgi:hypothetical protein
MHFLCISFFCLHIMCMCVWFYFFHDWSTFFPHFPYVYVHLCLPFYFNIMFFFKVIGVLCITSLTTPPFQKVCVNCHVAYVIISPTRGVHYNACCSKSMVQKLGFFSWFQCNQWWTYVINYWGQMTWNNCAYDKIWILEFASSKPSSTPHFNSHSR